MKRVIFCADDFAQSPEISQGIVQLLDQGCLTATSVFACSPYWPEWGQTLSKLKHVVDIGLHFNLTEVFGCEQHSLAYWLLLSQLRCLSQSVLRDECLRQIDAYADVMGRLPDFIDGHQHVHALPVVRDALTDAIRMRWSSDVAPYPYIRAPDLLGDAGDASFKSRILKRVSSGFVQHLQTHGLFFPQWFGGLYSLNPAIDYAKWMLHWLTICTDQSLLMCHPGLVGRNNRDPIASSRVCEYAYFSSGLFQQHCEQAEIQRVVWRSFS